MLDSRVEVRVGAVVATALAPVEVGAVVMKAQVMVVAWAMETLAPGMGA